MSCKYEGLLPGEHPEYSLGLAFSLLLCEILLVPEVGMHLFEVHALDGSKGVLRDRRGRVHSGLFCSGGANPGDVFGAASPMATTVELALVALILQLSSILDAVVKDARVRLPFTIPSF